VAYAKVAGEVRITPAVDRFLHHGWKGGASGYDGDLADRFRIEVELDALDAQRDAKVLGKGGRVGLTYRTDTCRHGRRGNCADVLDTDTGAPARAIEVETVSWQSSGA
jgi:hypothetical protein